MDNDRQKIQYFQELMEGGLKECRLGNTKKAIELYEAAVGKASGEHSALILLNRLALAYFYDALENPSEDNLSLSRAVEYFRKVEKATYSPSDFIRSRAVALRNLSRPEFSGFGMGPSTQQAYAESALATSESLFNTDIVWFTQGVLTVMLRFPRIGVLPELKKLFHSEVWEYFWVARNEEKLAKRDWLITLAVHYFQVYPGLLSLWSLKAVNSWAIKWNLQKRYPEMTKQLMSAGETP